MGSPLPVPEHRLIAGTIPALIWRGAGAGSRPAIISLHGGGGRKEDVAPDAVARMMLQGITVVTLDAHLHGERMQPGIDFLEPGVLTGLLFVDVVEQTARDVLTVVEELGRDSTIDRARIGLRGGSMGGYIALTAVGLGAPARGVLSICGAADFAVVFAHRLEGVDPATLERVVALDPLNHVRRFPPRSVLMIHGVRDPVVPIAGQRALYDALVPLYAERPQDLLFLTHAGEHETSAEIETFGWDWLASRLV